MKNRNYDQLKAVLQLIEKNQTSKFLKTSSLRNSKIFDEVFESAQKLYLKLEAVEKMRLEVVNMKQVIPKKYY